MATEIVPSQGALTSFGGLSLPEVISSAGERASFRFVEFFTANIRNPNTREAYARAVRDFFRWVSARGLALHQLNPILLSLYIEEMGGRLAAPSVKQHLAAIRVLGDYLVTGGVVPMNFAGSVKGPKHVVKKGKTPVLDADQARLLLDSIDVTTIAGLRDRALIGVMVYSFARIGAVVGMDVGDYYADGKRWWLRLHEKGGKFHEVPVHHKAEEFLDAYLVAAGIADDKKGPLFRTVDRRRCLTDHRLHRTEALLMIKRRAREAGLPESIGCHTFRATGITVYLLNGGTLEKAQRIACHESPRTMKLYDRTSDTITLDEVERIVL